MDVRFNKQNTKFLVKATAAPIPNMNRHHLDWILEHQNGICGCLYQGWFTKKSFILEKVEDRYRLITTSKDRIYIYFIEDIDTFLSYINVGELEMDFKEDLLKDLEYVKTLPSTGILIAEDEKIFLYDFYTGLYESP